MRFVFCATAAALADALNGTDCICPKTSSNRNSCCSSSGTAGEGTGDFCGNWFQQLRCNGDTPICCNSDLGASCGVLGSSCSPGCILGYKGLGSKCSVIPPPAPSPASDAYDVKQAKAIATLAVGAGCNPTDEFRNFSCKACRDVGFDILPGSMRYVTHKEAGTTNATFAFIARLEVVGDAPKDVADCVVGIRGSKNLANYVEDAEFWKESPSNVSGCEGCQVHSGFYHAWADLESDAVEALATIGCTPTGPNNKVLVTGHSLGASAAIVSMFRLQTVGFDVQQSVVFELPRVGNKAFSQAFGKHFDRDIPVFVHTHAMDPVIHLPPTGIPGIEYQHVTAPEVYYFPSFNNEDFIVCEGPDDAACSARFALSDTITSGNDHCEGLVLSPNVNSDGTPDFCIAPSDFCSGAASSLFV